MNDWIKLEQHYMAGPQTQRIRGVDVVVYVSPHGVPKAVRGTSHRERGIFRIEFQYLDESEDVLAAPRVSRDGLVFVYLGRSSGRIERIDVAGADPDAAQISLKINVVEEAEKGLLELKDLEPALSKKLNFEAARSAIEESRGMMYSY
jgi:hypothetical protein